MIFILISYFFLPLAWLFRLVGKTVKYDKNIVVIQTAKIGDFVATTPVLNALLENREFASIYLVVHPNVAPLAGLYQDKFGEAIHIVADPFKGWRGRLRFFWFLVKNRIGLVLCLSPNSGFLIIPYLAGVKFSGAILPENMGYTYSLSARFLTHQENHIGGELILDTMGRLVKNMLDIRIPNYMLRLPLESSNRVLGGMRKAVVKVAIGVSAGNKMKALPLVELLNVINAVKKTCPYSDIYLCGSEEDGSVAREIESNYEDGSLKNCCGKYPLKEMAYFLSEMDVYLGVDSGLTYIADAVGVPVIDIVGPADYFDQRPLGKKVLLVKSSASCAPCSHYFNAPYTCKRGTPICIRNVDLSLIQMAITKIDKMAKK